MTRRKALYPVGIIEEIWVESNEKLLPGLRQLTLEIVHLAQKFYASQRNQSPLYSQWKEHQSQPPEAD